MTTRRQFLQSAVPFSAATVTAGCRAWSELWPDGATRAHRAIRKGADYLWRVQSPGGGWHSRTYGLLASGQSLTPFVLRSLLATAPGLREPETDRIARAFEFIATQTDQDGAVGRMDPVANDYPNYATALAITAYKLAKPTGWWEGVTRLAGYLRSQQLADDLGWSPGDPAYGAWGVGGSPRRAPRAGHVDLSMTRHVIQALRMAGAEPHDPALQRARIFVERCQNYGSDYPNNLDGGFYFSTVVLDANKAGETDGRFRSYSTATADGLLCLRALGYAPDHPRVRAAHEWLLGNLDPGRATGFEGEAYQRWPAGLRFYNAAAATATLIGGGVPSRSNGLAEDLIQDTLRSLASAQNRDGSWSSSENLVKEDDPLIATGFALSALAVATGRGTTE